MFKKLFITLLCVVVLSGCSVLEIADMVLDDDCIYRGTVERVTHLSNTTYVTFEGGKQVTCLRADWVEVGDWIEARETDNIGKSVFDVACEFDR